MYSNLIDFTKKLYSNSEKIPLHEPFFDDQDKKALLDVIDSSFVSSIGEMTNNFEDEIKKFTKSKYAIATVNGTSALHMSLMLSGVVSNDEVITQSLTFVATSNAITYCDAIPNYLDVDKDTLSLSPKSLENFLSNNCEIRNDGFCWNTVSNRRIKTCIIMHTFGLAGRSEKIKEICERYNIFLIEDAAESLGTFSNNNHTGTIADIGILSFNGNKIITTGGGGMILTQKKIIEEESRHLTTTAKIPHQWNFDHDAIGFNYRMPNLNAALGMSQMKKLPRFLKVKRNIAECYQKWGEKNSMVFIREIKSSSSNYWLNALLAENLEERNKILEITNKHDVITRPIWTPMHQLRINKKFKTFVPLKNSDWLFERIVCMPSSFSEELNLKSSRL